MWYLYYLLFRERNISVLNFFFSNFFELENINFFRFGMGVVVYVFFGFVLINDDFGKYCLNNLLEKKVFGLNDMIRVFSVNIYVFLKSWFSWKVVR